MNRAARRQRTPSRPRIVARHRKGLGSIKRRTARAELLLRGRRTVDDGLFGRLDAAFGVPTAIALLLFTVGREGFDEHERARRRARGKRRRAARRAGRRTA